jgi:hypothetical protein
LEIHGISSYSLRDEAQRKVCVFHILTRDVAQLDGTLKTILNVPHACHFLFTQASSYKECDTPYGKYLREYIEANKLGTVVETVPAVNRNSDNYVVAYLWTLDKPAIKAWVEAHIEELRYKVTPLPTTVTGNVGACVVNTATA